MTVGDLLLPQGNEYPICRGRIIALSGKTGRQVFDTQTNKRQYIERFSGNTVSGMYAGVKTDNRYGFAPQAQPVITIYIREN